MPAQVDFDRGREPAQVELGRGAGAGHEKGGFGQAVFGRDLLHEGGGQRGFERAHAGGVAGEGRLGEGIDVEIAEHGCEGVGRMG